MTEFRYLEDVVTLGCDHEKCIGGGMCTVVCPHAVFTSIVRLRIRSLRYLQ